MKIADWAVLRAHAPGGYRAALLAARSPIRAQLAEYRQHAARVTLLDLTPAVGVAWFPLVAPPRATAQGCLARVEANPGGADLDEEVVRRVRECVCALVGLPVAPLLDAVPLSLHGVPESWSVSGRSLELASVLALVSALVKTPLAAATVVSGCVEPDHRVGPVGHLEEKARICALEAPTAASLLCDEHLDLLPWLDARLPTGWRRRLYAALNASPERQAREAWLAYEARDNGRAERLAARARTCTSGYERALAHWVEGACRMHRGGPAALELLMEAVRWFRDNRCERRYEAEDLSAFAGVALLDNGRAAEAVEMLAVLLASLDAVPQADRYVDWATAMVKVAGTLRRALVAAGRLEDAIDVQERHALPACRLARAEAARCHMDLGATLAQAGRREEAVSALTTARDALPDTSDHFRASTQRYLELFEVRAGLQQPTWRVAPFRWRDHPQPLEALEQVLADGESALDAYMAEQLATGSPLSYPQLLAVLRVAGVAVQRWGPRPWTVRLAEAALEARPEQDAPMREAISALRGGDSVPFLRVAPY